ncbi:MAG: AAA family ATPase [Bdellovibrionota bacterium]
MNSHKTKMEDLLSHRQNIEQAKNKKNASLTQPLQMESFALSKDQEIALNWLRSGENVFLTGGAGSGKSYLIREYRKEVDSESLPILASTGVAAVLLGGRTFHSFFGLGIMEGGPRAAFERAIKNSKLLKKIKKSEGVIIDEISMISGAAFETAEMIARKARESDLPWGGLRVIAVGDFAQLPPVGPGSQKDWCFRSPAWEKTGFQVASLKYNQRVQEDHFLEVLNLIRQGKVTPLVRDFLNEKLRDHDEDAPGTRLFPRRNQSEDYNQKKLAEINEEEIQIPTIYIGTEKHRERLAKSSPVPELLKIKLGCEILFLQNDPQKRWVNGTRGKVIGIETDKIKIRKNHGREVQVEKVQFSMLDAEGQVIASMVQFPLTLAYATTIHKSQGATLDEIWCDLGALWEPGQAYVALSRLRSSSGLNLLRWNPKSVFVDPVVEKFYQALSLEF